MTRLRPNPSKHHMPTHKRLLRFCVVATSSILVVGFICFGAKAVLMLGSKSAPVFTPVADKQPTLAPK